MTGPFSKSSLDARNRNARTDKNRDRTVTAFDGSVCILEERQVQKKFESHKDVFKITGDYSVEKLTLFQDKLEKFLKDPNLTVIQGTYRKAEFVTHYLDEDTWINVMVGQDTRAFLSVWVLGKNQLYDLLAIKNFH